MNINAIGFGQVTAPEGTQGTDAAKPKGFAQALGIAQSGAPPGPPSPTTGAKVGEEVATVGPNAPSLSPDSFPLIQANVNVVIQATSDAGGKDAPAAGTGTKSTEVDPTALAMAAASLNIGLFPTPTVVPGQFVSPTAAMPPPAVVMGGSKPVADPVPTLPTVVGKTGSPTLLPTPSVEPPKAPPVAPTIVPPAVRNAPEKTPPTASTGESAQQPLAPSVAPRSAQTPTPQTLPTSTAPAVVVPTSSSVEEGQETAAKTEMTSPTAKADAPAPTASNVRLGKKGEAKVTATDQHVTSEEGSGEVKVTKVAAKDADLQSDGGSSNGKPVQDPISGVAPTASDSPAPVHTEKPSLRPGDLNLVVRQINDKMELMAATRPKDGVTIMLQPERLGSITMTVKAVGGGVEAHISASDDNVRTALEQNRAMLGQSLADRGIKLDAVSIAAQTRDSTMAQSQANQQQQQQQAKQSAQQQQTTQSFGFGREPLTAQQARQTVRSFSGVDLWI